MKKIVIISDFDGTITKKDTLVAILNRFASPAWHKIERLVNEGRLGTRIALKKEFDLCRVTKKEFVNFIKKNIKIDRGFKKFIEFCQKNKIKFLIVSGGFGLNINIILSRSRLSHIPYYANIITFNKNLVKVKFPYKSKGCKDCGHCKAPYIRRYKRKGYFTIYIGDSVTDRCPARVAALVFAKHNLAEYCKAKGIGFIPYNTFGEIEKYLQNHVIARPNKVRPKQSPKEIASLANARSQ